MIAHNHADDIDPRLDELLLRWEELQRAGRKPLRRRALLHLPRAGRRARPPHRPAPARSTRS